MSDAARRLAATSYALASLMLALGACQGQAVGAGDPDPGGETEAPDSVQPGADGFALDASTVVTLERGSCYGSCPVYTLRISGDGAVSYVGQMYVKVLGSASNQVPVSEVQALVEGMLQARYFELSVPEDCRSISTDAATAITSLTLDGQTHTVDHYHGNGCAPEALRPLEDRIDEVAGSSQWLR